MSTAPTEAQLKERLDLNLKEAVEKITGRPFTEGSIDDLREELLRRGFRLIDTSRERFYVDERVYSRACYELGFYRQTAQYLTKVCRENGFDIELVALELAKPIQADLGQTKPISANSVLASVREQTPNDSITTVEVIPKL